MTIKTTLATLNEKKYAITSNTDLSQEGKKKAMAALNAEVSMTRGIVLSKLAEDWRFVRSRYKTMEVMQAATDEAEAKRWDYERLNYLSQAVKAQFASAVDLASGKDLDAVAALYTKNSQSGDKHLARVSAEIGADVVRSRFGRTPETQPLMKRMGSDLDTLTTTPEQAEVKAKGKALADTLNELIEDTSQADIFFDGNPGAFDAKPRQFARLMDGVTRTVTTNPDNFEAFMVTNITIKSD